MRLAFDGSSIMWSCLLGGQDKTADVVEIDGKKEFINTAAYGYEKVINLMIAAMRDVHVTPIDTILVIEGMNSKAPRRMIFSGYKGTDKKRPQDYDQFMLLRAKLIETWRQLGGNVLTQDNVEADDVLGWLAANIRSPLTIVSNDNDLAVLNGTNQHGAMVQVRVDGEMARNKYGVFEHKYITIYKALCGDSSDKISGIVGFGPKAWQEFHARFGQKGMEEMVRMAESGTLADLEEDAMKDKFIKKIFDGRHEFLQSYRLAKIYPQWVNTMATPLKWLPGFVHGRVQDERLSAWSASRRLVTSDNWDSFVPWALRELQHRDWYALDIETSTGQDSDDWLEAQGNPDGVDVIGSALTGMSLTFGRNMQFTVYISIDHRDTKNVTKDQLFAFLQQITATPRKAVIHNTMFEGPVLFNEFGEQWKDNGFEGFYPNWLDTKLEASYVNENQRLGLKHLSKYWLDYDQVSYDEVTTLEVPHDGARDQSDNTPMESDRGGKFLAWKQKEVKAEVAEEYTVDSDEGPVVHRRVIEPAVFELWEKHQFKMNELSAKHVFAYACDDTQTTAGLHNFFMLFMELENTWHVYLDVEIDASYLHAQSFINGVDIDLAKRNELMAEDSVVFEREKLVLDAYLVKHGWDGTVCPVYTEVDYKAVKEAYLICMGKPIETKMRTASKIIDLIKDEAPTFAGACTDVNILNEMVRSCFKAAPTFNTGSPQQKAHLLYEVMGLPERVFNKLTDKMKEDGRVVGNPKTDNLAIAYALKECDDEQKAVLMALRIMKMVETRRSLFYEPYPYFVHWKTGKVHSNHNQCGTNTRRASSSRPNLQQQSKHAKVEGYNPRVRELILPHKRNAVIISFDFKSQEILLMAEWSQDPELIGLFVGDNPKDMHSITGCGIYNATHGAAIVYEEYIDMLADELHPEHKKIKAARALGKAVNFGSQYRIAAKKLSTMLFVTQSEAQVMLDAKADAFPVAEEWSLEEMRMVKQTGVVHTMLGAVRHLGEALTSGDFVQAGKAERQSLSFRIQGSAAEMTKLAEGRMWKERLEQRFDCRIIAAVHDEVVASVTIEDLFEFAPAMHACMIAQYANMTLPIRSSISFGPDFGRQIEIGDTPDKEAIDNGLTKLFKMLGVKESAPDYDKVALETEDLEDILTMEMEEEFAA